MFQLRYKQIAEAVAFCMLLSTSEWAAAEDSNVKKIDAVGVATDKDKAVTVLSDPSVINNKKLQSQLESSNALNKALLEKKLANLIAKIEQLRLEKEYKHLCKDAEEESVREAHDKTMRLLNMEKEQLALEMELARMKFASQMKAHTLQIATLDAQAQLQKSQTQLLEESKKQLQAEVENLQAQSKRAQHIQRKPLYLKDPLRKKDNVLVLSDRCVALTGVINNSKANYIVDQLQYFNNKSSEYPIFIVIDNSPGGEPKAGFDILQTIKHIKAPVYVVVKQYAASMAAVITTLATKSYAYPNATILHHQPATMHFGCCLNVRESKEEFERLDNLWKRLGGPVAKKMGISLDTFTKRLYQKSMDGAWEEYANDAQKLKWIDHVVNGIEDSAICDMPDAEHYSCRKYWDNYYNHGRGSEDSGEHAGKEAQHNHLDPRDFDFSYKPNRKMHRPIPK